MKKVIIKILSQEIELLRSRNIPKDICEKTLIYKIKKSKNISLDFDDIFTISQVKRETWQYGAYCKDNNIALDNKYLSTSTFLKITRKD